MSGVPEERAYVYIPNGLGTILAEKTGVRRRVPTGTIENTKPTENELIGDEGEIPMIRKRPR